MRLGAPVGNFRDFEEWAELHVEKGYGAAYCPIGADADGKTIDALLRTCAKHDLVLAEVGAWKNPLDAEKGEENIRFIVGQLQLADKIGARCCVDIAGSLSSIWDGPHPDNLTDETFGRIVETTQRIIDAAKPQNTYFTLEPMPYLYPCDEESTARLLEKVDREHFAVHADMCNMMNSYEKTLNTAEITRRYFARFANVIRSVHCKDIAVTAGHLPLHIDEVIVGRGVFDHRALLEECAKLPDVPVMLEHLSDSSEYDEAANHIKTVAKEAGLSFVSAK